MTQFPNSPSVGDKVTFNDATYEWDGNRWKSLGTIAVGPTGPAGPIGNTGADGAGGGGATLAAGAGLDLSTIVAGVGYTLGIDPTAIVHVAGVSADGGITAGGEVRSSYFYGIGHETGLDVDTNNTLVLRAASSQVISAGTTKVQVKKLLQANELIHAKAGISADGGITAGGEIRAVSDIVFNGGSAIQNDAVSRNSYIYFEDGNDGQIRFRPDNMPGFSITRAEGVIVDSGVRFRSNPIAEFLAGISLDVGITFPDGTFQSSAASGSGVTAGAGMVLTGSTLGIDPTAVVHVAGISSDGGITAAGNIKTAGRLVGDVVQSEDGELSRYGYVANDTRFDVYTGNNDARMYVSSFGIQAPNGAIQANTFLNAGTYVHAGTGISLDAGGITFADGTFQSSAASGSTITAGAGMTLAGSTLGIDSTAVVHVAGVSADGGITTSGNIALDDRITFSNAGYITNSGSRDNQIVMTDSSSGSIRLKPDGNDKFAVYGYPGLVKSFTDFQVDGESTLIGKVNAQAGISSDAGITVDGRVFGESVSVDGHLLVKDGSQLQIKPNGFLVTAIDGNGIYTFGRNYATTYVQSGSYVHAGTGVSLDAGGITFADGTFQSTAASGSGGSSTQKYSMGFFYDGRGSNLSTGYISDIVRNVEQGATATKVTVYYPTAVTATAGVELYKVGTTYFNSPGASFEANGTLIAGVSVDSGDYGASAGIAVALSEDDMVFGRLTNSGHTDKLQIFLKYESSS